MFNSNDPYAHPVGSFAEPVSPPLVDPDEGDLVSVAFNPAWLPYIEGSLNQLQLQSTWAGSPEDIYLAQQRAANLRLLFAEAVEPTPPSGISPFWDDADGGDTEGTPDESTYSWNERVEDWAIAAFVATSGVPGAAAAYLTIAPKFRLFFKRRDWGGIAKIFIDDVQIAQVDTYSPTPDVVSIDVIAQT